MDKPEEFHPDWEDNPIWKQVEAEMAWNRANLDPNPGPYCTFPSDGYEWHKLYVQGMPIELAYDRITEEDIMYPQSVGLRRISDYLIPNRTSPFEGKPRLSAHGPDVDPQPGVSQSWSRPGYYEDPMTGDLWHLQHGAWSWVNGARHRSVPPGLVWIREPNPFG